MTYKLKNNTGTLPYFSKDLAIIIPTKDRPKEVKRLLISISQLDCKVGRIIIIASGQSIHDVVMSFAENLPVEYHTCEPGQIQQRNRGIELLDDCTRLVATMDDDAVFHKTAISEMIKFWNNVEAETAGVGFNIINQKGHQHNWLRGMFGVSHPEPGKVLKSGRVTSIINIQKNIRSEWLNGGGTVWRQSILIKNKHQSINSRWAVCEDLIFSYPLGKLYPLYVCNSAQIEIDLITSNSENIETYIYRGKTQFLWAAYFVTSNSDMSIKRYLCSQFLHLLTKITKGIINKQKFFWGVGMIHGFVLIIKIMITNKSLIQILEETQ